VRFEADLALVLADFKGEVYGESFGTAADETFTGTGKSQFIRAGDGADTVNGLGGTDLLYGEGGADSLSGGDAGDSLHGEADKDRLNGGAGRDHLFGGAAVDKLQGGDDGDVLEGGQGADRLNGGAKADVFRFLSVADRGDIIEDFTGQDFIGISAAGFGGGLVAGAALVTGMNFVAGASPNAPGAQGCFLYDTDDGRLFWDADGNGAGGRLLIATLTGAPALGAGDFLVS
jgi:Ca2+-binding RTX toxin-like protein